MRSLGNEHPLVLVIDDEREVLDEVAAVLAKANLTCHCCLNSQEALAAADAVPPALILCDVSLLGESGVELCDRLKQRPGLKDVPVMFLSGAQLPDIIRRSYPAGGIYCLRKPFDPTVLMELIDQAMAVPEA